MCEIRLIDEDRMLHAEPAQALDDAVEHLRTLLGDDPETLRLLAQERLRTRLTDAMRQVRQFAGLTQTELATRMGISQARVSRLESVDHDRRLDSVAAYLHAVGADLLMALKIGDEIVHVCSPAQRLVVDVPAHDMDLIDDDAATPTAVIERSLAANGALPELAIDLAPGTPSDEFLLAA